MGHANADTGTETSTDIGAGLRAGTCADTWIHMYAHLQKSGVECVTAPQMIRALPKKSLIT